MNAEKAGFAAQESRVAIGGEGPGPEDMPQGVSPVRFGEDMQDVLR